jgi:cell wall-associated NlpC family hydrolase
MNELQNRILNEAHSWVGTPWRAGGSCARGKNGGVDCSRFVMSVFSASGLCQNFKLPVVPGIYCMDRKNPSLILDFLRGHPELCTEIEGDAFEPADVVTFREGMVIHHVGIVTEDGISMISCRQPQGVNVHVFKGDDYFTKRRNAVFRANALCH